MKYGTNNRDRKQQKKHFDKICITDRIYYTKTMIVYVKVLITWNLIIINCTIKGSKYTLYFVNTTNKTRPLCTKYQSRPIVTTRSEKKHMQIIKYVFLFECLSFRTAFNNATTLLTLLLATKNGCV